MPVVAALKDGDHEISACPAGRNQRRFAHREGEGEARVPLPGLMSGALADVLERLCLPLAGLATEAANANPRALLMARPIHARRAHEVGLVDDLVGPGAALATGRAVARNSRRLRRKSRVLCSRSASRFRAARRCNAPVPSISLPR